jgi:hypothetical protein
MNNPFRTLGDMTQQLGILLPPPRWHWSLIHDPAVGEVHGLPMARGRLVATNGIIGVLLMPGTKSMFVHIDHFEPDVEPTAPKTPKARKASERITRIVREYV